MSIRHAKTSGIPNPADATLVGGADWDDAHTAIAPDDAYGIEVQAGGLGFEGGILVVTGDQSLITGSGFIIRAVPIINGRQIFDIDSWGSMNLAADPDGGGGLTITSGDDSSVLHVLASTDLANSRMEINVPLRTKRFTSDGTTTAPDDSYLDNGTFSLWLDDTPGATKLRIKAKDSNGTVVTGSVNLT